MYSPCAEITNPPSQNLFISALLLALKLQSIKFKKKTMSLPKMTNKRSINQ